MTESIIERPLTREEADRLRADIHAATEPFVDMLCDLYNRSLSTMRISDGVVTTAYSHEVEKMAEQIREEMKKAVLMASRYKGLR